MIPEVGKTFKFSIQFGLRGSVFLRNFHNEESTKKKKKIKYPNV